jgi:hypothetical protein
VRAVALSKYVRDYDAQGHAYPGQMCLARHAECTAHVSPDALARLGHFAVDHFGYPYDRQMIAKIAARITLPQLVDDSDRQALLDDWQSAGLERDREYICSEYAWECFQTLGLDIPHDPRGFVTPADFACAPQIQSLGVIRSEGASRG